LLHGKPVQKKKILRQSPLNRWCSSLETTLFQDSPQDDDPAPPPAMIATAFAQTSPFGPVLYDSFAFDSPDCYHTSAAALLLLSKAWRSDGALLILEQCPSHWTEKDLNKSSRAR
jgi:hypothetical protein